MSTYDQILGLRTVRRFQGRPVSDKDLAAVLEAARWTGSAKNLQLWSFIVVDDPEQKARLVECGSFMTPVVNAPMAIALVRLDGGYDFDTGRVAQNIMLAADAIGLGSCPVTLHDDAAAKTVLGLPDDVFCRYAIAMGYENRDSEKVGRQAQRQHLPIGRKSLEELVHRNQWGS